MRGRVLQRKCIIIAKMIYASMLLAVIVVTLV